MSSGSIEAQIVRFMRQHGLTVDEAVRRVHDEFWTPMEIANKAAEPIRRRIAENKRLDSPTGTYDLQDETRFAAWYSGPQDDDVFWPALRNRLENSGLRDAVEDIDVSSTKVVAQLAAPASKNLKKRGLVLGYVQSGKTANYTAVMAKAADAGYRFVIVLSGLHNNLRKQTQVRVSRDLGAGEWHNWTTEDADFGGKMAGAAVLGGKTPSLAVVKKNASRLRSLRDWLREIPEDIRVRAPILLVDDEADQATPNTALQAEALSGINRLVREIWSEVKTGTYVGYTATPFANVFMDPTDEDELYPADFIISLSRPPEYFGAERMLGREPLDEDDEPSPGMDVVRRIYDTLPKPPSTAAQREDFDPPLPESLRRAIVWYIVATSIRAARGQGHKHSSMLVHTTHYVHPHFAMGDRVRAFLDEIAEELRHGDSTRFADSYENEGNRANEVASVAMPPWEEVEPWLRTTIEETRVVIDNGASEDRLDYGRIGENGEEIAEKVIVIGGGTLSRGLTVEGLVASYFTRASNTYDTLLQMGRWFGYRPGYEDLPRIWMQAGLDEDYRFLALVEEELRQEIEHLERMNVPPRQLGVRVRAHPGRLAIVAKNKMGSASKVMVNYSGTRLQTFIFDVSDEPVQNAPDGALTHNLDMTRRFVEDVDARYPFARIDGVERWIARGVPASLVRGFIETYSFHPDQMTMNQEHMSGWINRSAKDTFWNVVVMGSSGSRRSLGGAAASVEDVHLTPKVEVRPVNRAPLCNPDAQSGIANIKALMSHNDWFLDLNPDEVSAAQKAAKKVASEARNGSQAADPKAIRAELADGMGLLVLYPISKDSTPQKTSLEKKTRRDMNAPEDLIGVGIVFPDVDKPGFASEGSYFSVKPDWEHEYEEAEDDELPPDSEGLAPAPIV